MFPLRAKRFPGYSVFVVLALQTIFRGYYYPRFKAEKICHFTRGSDFLRGPEPVSGRPRIHSVLVSGFKVGVPFHCPLLLCNGAQGGLAQNCPGLLPSPECLMGYVLTS